MPSKRPRKRVAISGERLRVGMESADLSSRGLAERCSVRGVKVSHQNIENIIAGEQVTCRRELRDALALVLELPSAEWLAAEHDLRDLPSWEAPRTIGVEGMTGVDLNQRALPGTRWHETLQKAREFFKLPAVPTVMPPRYQILAWRLAKEIEVAWGRSFGMDREPVMYPKTFPDSADATRRRVENRWSPLYALPAVAALLSLSFWRRVVMEEPYGGLLGEEEMNGFAEGMEQAVRTLLRPWLDGEMELRAASDLETLFAKLGDLGRALARIESRDQVERHQELVRHHEQTRPSR